MRQPSLIVVTGQPGAGKTTLAHALARAVPCLAVCRDEIKEGIVFAAGDASDTRRDLQRVATDAFFDALAVFLGRGVTVVAEAAFQHKVWAPRLEPFQTIAQVRLVLCEIGAEHALARRVARDQRDADRARFHPEGMVGDGLDGAYDPPRLDIPTLRVDTSDGYQPAFETIVEFARA